MTPESSASAQVWVHNLNPFIIQFSQNFGIRWYGMAYLAGFILSAFLMIFIANRGRRVIKPELVTDYVTYCVLGVMIGGRFGYALFYGPDLLTDFSTQFPFWGVLRVWEGGMASHGGIIGVILAAVFFARRHQLSWLHLGDLTALGGSVGIFFGRIANFMNGELFGRESSPHLPWAVKFPGEMFLWFKHDAERQLSDPSSHDLLPNMNKAVESVGGNLTNWQLWISQVRTNSGGARFQITEMIERIIHAIENGNQSARVALGEFLTPRHPSQLYEGLMEGLLLFIITFLFWRKPHRPGVVGGLWLTIYAVVRIIGEQFRMPDAHIGYQLFGLTRGQWLSIGMLFLSAALWIWAARRNVPVVGGWGKDAVELRRVDP